MLSKLNISKVMLGCIGACMISMPFLAQAEKVSGLPDLRQQHRVNLPLFPLYGFKLDKKKHITPVSGYAGTAEEVMVPHQSALNSITWWESHNKPVKILTGHTPLTGMIRLSDGSITRPSDNTSEFAMRPYSSAILADKKQVGTGGFIYQLRVCTSKKNSSSKERLKGIEVWVKTMSVDPVSFTTQPSGQKAKHKSCKKWHPVVSCADHEIASGLVVHHGSNNAFSGIALICQKAVATL